MRSDVSRLALAAVAAIVAFLALSGTALADLKKPKDKEALRLYKEANAHYNVREVDQAIEKYKGSIKIEESEAAVYNLALVLRKERRFEDSIWFYKRLLKIAKLTKADVKEVESLIAGMDAEFELQTAEKPPSEPLDDEGSAPDGPPKEPVEPIATVLHPPAESSERPEWYADGWGWALSGAGVVVAGVGAGFLFNADTISARADDEPDEDRRAELRSSADTRRAFGVGGTIVGAGLIAAGVIKLALVPSSRSDASPSVTVTSRSVSLAWRF